MIPSLLFHRRQRRPLLCFNELCTWCVSTEELDLEDGQWEDVHVITGALKLFFRELPEPLFPYSHFNKFISAISEQNLWSIHLNYTISPVPRTNLCTQVFKLTLLMYSYCIYNWLTTSVLLFQEFLTTTQNCLACMNWSKHFLLQITTPWSSFLGIYAGLFFFFKYLSFWFYYFIIFYFIFGLFPSVSEVETNKVQILSGSS